jgi:biotin carboxyl carrier protein
MKFHAEIGDETCEIEVRRDGDKISAKVGGREYDLEVSEPEAGVFLFKNRGVISEVSVSPTTRVGETVSVNVRGNSYDVKVFDPKRLRGSGAEDDHSHGFAEIRTVMPGKVVRILKESGSVVEKGEGVMIVEAMKMQNEIKAPKAGVVKVVKVEEGGTVAAGDVLAVIE